MTMLTRPTSATTPDTIASAVANATTTAVATSWLSPSSSGDQNGGNCGARDPLQRCSRRPGSAAGEREDGAPPAEQRPARARAERGGEEQEEDRHERTEEQDHR
jgi:hypothetical protein